MITCRHRQFAHALRSGYSLLIYPWLQINSPFPIQSHSLSLSFACAIQEYYDAYYAGTNDSKEKTVSNDVDDDDKEVDDIFFPDWLKDFDNLEQKFGGVFDQVTAATFAATTPVRKALFCKINSFLKELHGKILLISHRTYVLIRTNEQLRMNS